MYQVVFFVKISSMINAVISFNDKKKKTWEKKKFY